MKFRMNIMVMCFLWLVAGGSPFVHAGNPPPLYNKPVKLDDSGRPLFNSWEQQEYLRKQRARQKRVQEQSQSKSQTVTPGQTPIQTTVQNQVGPQTPSSVDNSSQTKGQQQAVGGVVPSPVGTAVSDSGPAGSDKPVEPLKNAATGSTPSSAVINRPMQDQGDPTQTDGGN